MCTSWFIRWFIALTLFQQTCIYFERDISIADFVKNLSFFYKIISEAMLSVVRITLKLRYRGANGIGRSFQAVVQKLPENENQSILKMPNSSLLVY